MTFLFTDIEGSTRLLRRIGDRYAGVLNLAYGYSDTFPHYLNITHAEAPNLEWDVDLLLQKQRAGAGYAVTQLFYDNEVYLRYVKAARDHGVTIPIIPGLKILTRREQLSIVPRNFQVDVPNALVDEVMSVPPEAAVERGIAWAARQTLQLFEAGVPSVHFYVMQNTTPFVTMMEQLTPQL